MLKQSTEITVKKAGRKNQLQNVKQCKLAKSLHSMNIKLLTIEKLNSSGPNVQWLYEQLTQCTQILTLHQLPP